MYHRLTPEQYAVLMGKVTDGRMGEDYFFSCNAAVNEHVHIRRLGDEGDGLAGRVGVFSHAEEENPSVLIFLSAPEARMLAATILQVADELEGITPLMFVETSEIDCLVTQDAFDDDEDDDEDEDNPFHDPDLPGF